MCSVAEPGAPLRRLTRRSQFLAAARGSRAGRKAFSLQAAPVEAETAGIGYTVTKRIGNAPERNRIKRRLRAAARACAGQFMPRHDYVLVGRREALEQPFGALVGDLTSAIARIHSSRPPSFRPPANETRSRPAQRTLP